MKRSILIAFLLCCLNVCFAVQSEISVEDIACNIEVIPGSEALSIRAIDQASNGMIWFGTDKNLFSYDGYNFQRRHDINGNNDHFQINSLVCFDDKVLLGCIDGVVIYNIKEETFSQIDFLKGNETHDLEYDRNEGVIWIGSDAGLFKYDIRQERISAAVIDSEVKPINIWSLKIHGNSLYIGMRKGFGRYHLDGSNGFDVIPDEVFEKNYSTIGSIESIDDDSLLIGASRFLAVYDTKSNRSRLVSEFSWVKNVGRLGHLFFLGTDAGLFSYDSVTSEISNIKKTVVWGILTDHNGNLWFGTDNGLMVSMRNRLITRIEDIPTDANHLFSSISGNNEGLYFAGGSFGMVVFDGADDGISTRWYKMGDEKYPFRHNKVRQIRYDRRKDDIWVSTAAGVLRYNKETELFDSYFVPNSSFYSAYDMLFDRDRIWFAMLEGLCCVQNDSIVKMYTSKDGLTNTRINQIAQDRNDRIWMRTFDRNIYILDTATDEISQFNIDNDRSVVRGDQLFADSSGDIWITSANHVYKINADDIHNDVTDYNLKGDYNVECVSLIEVDNSMWACYPNSLYIMDRNKTDIHHIWTRINYSEMYYDSIEKKVMLGALDRIDAIRIADLEQCFKASNGPVHITGVIVNDNYILSQKEISSGKITLPYNYNNLRVSFTNFGFDQGSTTRFRYRFENKSDQWNDTEGRGNSLQLYDLSPGTYRLYIASYGGETPVAPVLTIHINRPWYLSTVAIFFYISIAALFVYGLTYALRLRKRIKHERIEKAYEMSQAQSKINFFADISHELKTPLSLIIAPVSKLLHEVNNQEQRRILEMVHDNAIKLNSLIHATLSYYKGSYDKSRNVISSDVEVVEFVYRIFQTYKESTPDLYFVFESKYEQLYAMIDVIKTETIISNILSNSCKYTPKEGNILLILDYDSEEGQLLIKISDTGIGIPKDEIPFIFQRYYQSSRTVKRYVEGTGLGLSIVKSYIEMLGGNISVTSDESGTTTMISIPVQQDKESVSMQNVPHEHESTGSKPVVAIIDDNKSVCEFLESILNDKYRCISAYNGKNGLKLCKDMLPDLIISDVVMPVMDGLEMCRRIRETSTLATVPIILLTAKDDNETEKLSINLNIESFIAKPFDLDTLLAKVNSLIGQKERVETHVRMKMISEPKPDHSLSADEKFLVEITRIIENNIDDSELSVAVLCEKSRYNEKQLYRKIKSLTGMSTIEYVKSIRLKKAAQLLQNGNFTVSEVMYSVGFSNSSYFARAFFAQFGKTPKDYLNSYRNKQDVHNVI